MDKFIATMQFLGEAIPAGIVDCFWPVCYLPTANAGQRPRGAPLWTSGMMEHNRDLLSEQTGTTTRQPSERRHSVYHAVSNLIGLAFTLLILETASSSVVSRSVARNWARRGTRADIAGRRSSTASSQPARAV